MQFDKPLFKMFQLAFVNNPIGGALILAVLFSTNWKVAVGSVLGGSIATLAEMVKYEN
jgi:urea transporter